MVGASRNVGATMTAITLARSVSDTFSGIAPADTAGFIAAQLIGALLAAALGKWLFAPDQS